MVLMCYLLLLLLLFFIVIIFNCTNISINSTTNKDYECQCPIYKNYYYYYYYYYCYYYYYYHCIYYVIIILKGLLYLSALYTSPIASLYM
jgi:hypothetical protein